MNYLTYVIWAYIIKWSKLNAINNDGTIATRMLITLILSMLEPPPSGWANYFPPCASSSVTKKSKKRGKQPISSDDLPTPPPYVSDSSSLDLPSYAPSFHSDDKEPLCLAINEDVVSSMRRIPKPKSAKKVLGLPSPKVWNAMQVQAKGVHKTMPGF
ncbi:hypothetical protein CTI12_AA249610 [Artemisia annua]|uniref:Uncharacterized protein n=1 Tax=Artemisia annua TaxID=35608 RepID=A0A2U1NMG3_ARTAN|nr:hypothetical protein CTI12_AA249610 [Artemisia annua]